MKTEEDYIHMQLEEVPQIKNTLPRVHYIYKVVAWFGIGYMIADLIIFIYFVNL
jgi:hypothetical protein